MSDQEVIEMRRVYVAVAALVVAASVALGTYAASTSARLGTSSASPQSVSTTIAQGNQRLSATEAALNRALAQRPPTLSGGRVAFVRPHPVIVNVSGLTNAVTYTPQAPTHFSDEGGHGD